MKFDFASIMPMLQRMFGGSPGAHAGPYRPSANLGQQRGPGGEQLPPIHSKLTRPQGGGLGSLLAVLPTILSAATDIFKAITGDPGYQARMKQNKQNQQATPSATAATTPSTPPPPPSTTSSSGGYIPSTAPWNPTPRSHSTSATTTTTPSSTSSSGGYIPPPLSTPLLDTDRTYSGQQQQQPPAIGSPGYFNTGSGRVDMPTQPGDVGGPMNMPTKPGDLGGSEAY